MKVFAHRGFSGRYPENTMLAFEKAVEAGADGIELDVHLSADGEVVIIHDELVDRTTDGTGLVGSKTLAQLKALDASAAFKGVYGKVEIPTLDEYLAFIRGTDLETNIELKTGVDTYPGIEKKVLELIDKYDLREKIIISSFNHYSVLRMKALAPDMRYGFLEESWVIGMPEYAKKYGMDGVHPLFNVVDRDYMDMCHGLGLAVNVWTVNTEEDIRHMLELGVDISIGNFPDLARKIVG